MTCNTPSWWCEGGKDTISCSECQEYVRTLCAITHRTGVGAGEISDQCFKCQKQLEITEVQGPYMLTLTKSNKTGGLSVQVEYQNTDDTFVFILNDSSDQLQTNR